MPGQHPSPCSGLGRTSGNGVAATHEGSKTAPSELALGRPAPLESAAHLRASEREESGRAGPQLMRFPFGVDVTVTPRVTPSGAPAERQNAVISPHAVPPNPSTRGTSQAAVRHPTLGGGPTMNCRTL